MNNKTQEKKWWPGPLARIGTKEGVIGMNVTYYVQPPLIVLSCAVVPRGNRSRMKHVVYIPPCMVVGEDVRLVMLSHVCLWILLFATYCSKVLRHLIPSYLSVLSQKALYHSSSVYCRIEAQVSTSLTPSSLSLNTSVGVVLQELASFMIPIN